MLIERGADVQYKDRVSTDAEWFPLRFINASRLLWEIRNN